MAREPVNAPGTFDRAHEPADSGEHTARLHEVAADRTEHVRDAELFRPAKDGPTQPAIDLAAVSSAGTVDFSPAHAGREGADADVTEEVLVRAPRPGAPAGWDLAFLPPSNKPGFLGRLGHYEVLEVLGRGGCGIVLKAFDEKLQRLVAVKVLGPQPTDDGARKRFLREARAAAAIGDRHVVSVYAVHERAIPYLAMEYIAGPSLQQRLDREGALPVREILEIGRQVASGLAAAHAQGLIHRDIKPANILLETSSEFGIRNSEKEAVVGRPLPSEFRIPNSEFPCVKITDFGLARAADDASITQSGFISGTPLYMAPEQAQDEPIDHRADLFSLGSVLYALCTGRPPFTASSTMAVLKRVCDEEPRPIREINPAIPPWLCAVVARLHAKKPADRFGTAREVADVFGQALACLEKHGATTEVFPPVAPTAVRPRPTKSRRWTVAAVTAVAVLGTVGAGLGWLTRRPGAREVEVVPANQKQIPAAAAPAEPPGLGAWIREVEALPPDRQVEAVTTRLRDLNPNFDGRVTHKIENGVVTELGVFSDRVTNIAPVNALTRLERLDCIGSPEGQGQLADLSALKETPLKLLFVEFTNVSDLSPLRGTKLDMLNCGHTPVSDLSALRDVPLTHLFVAETAVADLAPMKGHALTVLDCSSTRVSDLSPLQDAPLTWLKIANTPITDLSPLRGKKLGLLWCQGTKVADLSPLKGMPLRELWCDFQPGRDAEILRSLKTLEKINNKPAKDFWKQAGGR